MAYLTACQAHVRARPVVLREESVTPPPCSRPATEHPSGTLGLPGQSRRPNAHRANLPAWPRPHPCLLSWRAAPDALWQRQGLLRLLLGHPCPFAYRERMVVCSRMDIVAVRCWCSLCCVGAGRRLLGPRRCAGTVLLLTPEQRPLAAPQEFSLQLSSSWPDAQALAAAQPQLASSEYSWPVSSCSHWSTSLWGKEA